MGIKIIFLDIDGVLNKLSTKKIDSFSLDKELVENLKLLLNKTSAKIVISSSWRFNMDRIKASFSEVGINTNLIIGNTPDSLYGRGIEILTWLNEYHNTCKDCKHIKNWIAIDDDNFDMKSIVRLGKLVHTNPKKGLDENKLLEAIDKLNYGEK